MSVAAGNTGNYGCDTVSDPMAIYSDVLTVGSVDQAGDVSAFSSLGPVTVDGSNRIKPDLLAPGQGIISAFPNNAYIEGDGTSFSAPHVSGVVALMWSANPKLIGNIPLTRQILEETATPYSGKFPDCITSTGVPNDASGYGILNAYAAVKAALALK
jgi:subtilisin family serine protease